MVDDDTALANDDFNTSLSFLVEQKFSLLQNRIGLLERRRKMRSADI